MTLAGGFAIKRLRRGWRAGELRVLALALIISVGASSAVGLFSDRLRLALAAQSGEALGADAFVQSRHEIAADYRAAISASGLRSAYISLLPSVVLHGEQTTLAAIKAVPANYPLRNVLRIADQPYAEQRIAQQGPEPGVAWVDARLWASLQLQPDSVIQVGAARFPVTAVLAYEPDRGGSFTDLAPRVLINEQSLAATELLVPGARAQYLLQLAGSTEQLARARELELPRAARWVTPAEARPAVEATLNRAGQFLDLAVLAASLLAAAAIALAARLHGRRLQDEVALLKCLGAGGGQIVAAMALGLLLLALIAGLIGLLLGYGAQAVLVLLLGEVLQVSLPAPGPGAAFAALGMGILLSAGFGLPPVLAARSTPPIRVFARAVSAGGASALINGCAALTVALLLWLQTGELKIAASFAVATAVAIGVLALVAWLGVRLLAPLRGAGSTAWRYGLGNVSRRGAGSVGQVVALGLALMALLLLAVARGDLLEAWRDRLPADTPNQFLINIQADQVQPLTEFLQQQGIANAKLWPMARGRLIKLRGETISADSFEDPEAQRWVNRDFNLSWASELGDDNQLLAGELWAPDASGRAELSADIYAQERLQLELGDSLTIQFGDQPVEFTVTSFREVNWDSFRPNFFLVTMPGVLDQGIAANWLTSFYLPPERREVLRDLVLQFPNVTALDLETIMQQVRAIIDRVVGALEFMLLFAVAAGITVLLAAIETSRRERIREIALLRTLGASRRVIAWGLISEYAVLGLLAGSIGALGAQALAWLLATQVFQIEFGLQLNLLLTGASLGVALVAGFGWLSLRSVTNTPPALALKSHG